LEEKVIITNISNVAARFWIHPKLLKIFFFLNIIISRTNDWGTEALRFDALAKNPSIVSPSWLSQSELYSLYQAIPSSFLDSFTDHLWSFEKYSFKPIECRGDLQKYYSYRTIKDIPPWISLEKMLSIMYTIFSWNAFEHHFYGSWGGFYSIFPIIIVNDNQLFLYSKDDNCFYTKHIHNIYSTYIKDCLIANDLIDFSLYKYHIILVANFSLIFKKYGNRGYKYIQMEAGSIWTLCRLFFSNYNIPHVEIQGYLDNVLHSFLSQHLNMVREKTLVCHTICCN
jgi:hypothetical protein